MFFKSKLLYFPFIYVCLLYNAILAVFSCNYTEIINPLNQSIYYYKCVRNVNKTNVTHV